VIDCERKGERERERRNKKYEKRKK